MKILTGPQRPTLARQPVDCRAAKTETGAAAKPLPKGDKEVFYTPLDAELKNQQAERAKRIESIKSLVKAGKYRVSSRDIAEKMLSGRGERRPEVRDVPESPVILKKR